MRAKASGREVVVAPFTLWMDDTGLARKKYDPGLTAFISHSGMNYYYHFFHIHTYCACLMPIQSQDSRSAPPSLS